MGGRNVEIVVGTNEEYLLGYQLQTNKDGSIRLQQTYANHSHMGSVRQVAVVGNSLVSGSADEVIRIFNLHSRSEEGSIMEHQGTITHLSFYGTKHLFSASEDGKICIFNKKKKWKCEKTLKGHRGPVSSVSVHPSGKLALSVSKDRTMYTWNLIKGRKAYITNLKSAADSVKWSPAGTHYLLVRGSCVEVYLVDSAKLLHTVDFKQAISVITFITDELIAVGGEGQNISLYDIGSGGVEMLQWKAHKMRVKCICVLPWVSSATSQVYLASGSSDGTIKIWKLDLLLLTKPKLLGEVNTTCRIICMDAYPSLSKPTSASFVDSTKENIVEKVNDKGMQDEEDDVEFETFDDSDDVEDEELEEDGDVEDEELEEDGDVEDEVDEEEEDIEDELLEEEFGVEWDDEDLEDSDDNDILELEEQDVMEEEDKNCIKFNNTEKKKEKVSNTGTGQAAKTSKKKEKASNTGTGQAAKNNTQRKNKMKDNKRKSVESAVVGMSSSKKKKSVIFS
ncbi:hypothetical protein Pmani_008847 [Petrolisthes manimaculis]|uniref:P21-activated protein kinase-interacting protein 1-like n=1 Tax=Petrolisthes manimaculis TaxID=1843537 RepID=A0AAE1Q5L6_9EUCA|nr:hypothetical protein Pmani_008847 [Petrolisthes manimaculis]